MMLFPLRASSPGQPPRKQQGTIAGQAEPVIKPAVPHWHFSEVLGDNAGAAMSVVFVAVRRPG
jgi:hypothetical protein